VQRRSRAGRRLPVVVGGAAVLLVVLVGALLLVGRGPGDTVLAGVAVEGRDVGGLDRTALEQVVTELADQQRSQAVVVTGERGRVDATRGEVGEEAGVDATVEDAWSRGRGGFLADLRDRLRARMGTTIDVPLERAVDEVVLRAWVTDAAEELSEPPRDGAVELVGGEQADVEVVEPAAGEVVDVDDLEARLADALEEPGAIALDAPAQQQDPAITEADVDAVLPDARQAISGPVELTNPGGGADLVLSSAELAEVLAVTPRPEQPEGQRLELEADAERLIEVIGPERLAALEVEPVEATFETDGDAVAIAGGTAGFTLDADAAADRLLELATTEAPERSGALPGDTQEPERTREDAEALGITERVATFTTSYTCCPPRVTNIRRMAELVDGAIIGPGEGFSLNGHVGPRTEEKGFVEGGVIQDGELSEAVGGGVSQFATTFYNAAFFAGIRIDAFQPHSFYFERYPMGRESTIHFDAIDVAVTNDSPHAILVRATASDTAVTVDLYSTTWAQVEEFTGEPYDVVEGEVRDGFTVDFGRTITYPDGESRTEEHTHTYEPEDEPDDEDDEGDGDPPPPDEGD
jgi:vancomycin resistance protein YoaR